MEENLFVITIVNKVFYKCKNAMKEEGGSMPVPTKDLFDDHLRITLKKEPLIYFKFYENFNFDFYDGTEDKMHGCLYVDNPQEYVDKVKSALKRCQ
jgi:hypothetical protein